MKIQLDTGAMNALFPEGSEARVELQNAVIQNFIRKARFEKLENKLESLISTLKEPSELEINRIVANQLSDKFEPKSRSNYYFNELKTTKKDLQEFLETISQDAANAVMKEFMQKAESRFNEIIEESMISGKMERDLKSKIHQKINAYVEENCGTVIAEIAKKKIKELL